MLTNLLFRSLSFFTPHVLSRKYQFLIAFLSAFTLLFLKIWIPDIGRTSPFLLFTTVIILNGWFAGYVASITVTLLSALLVSFVLITPFGILNDHPVTSIEAGLFIAECFFVSFGVEYVKSALEEISLGHRLLAILLSSAMTYGIVILDEKNTIVGWSKGAQKIFGYAKEEIIGKPLSIISDKKNWFHRSTEPLAVRVKTHRIFSPITKHAFYIKIINTKQKKLTFSVPENISQNPPLSTQLQGTSQLL